MRRGGAVRDPLPQQGRPRPSDPWYPGLRCTKRPRMWSAMTMGIGSLPLVSPGIVWTSLVQPLSYLLGVRCGTSPLPLALSQWEGGRKTPL